MLIQAIKNIIVKINILLKFYPMALFGLFYLTTNLVSADHLVEKPMMRLKTYAYEDGLSNSFVEFIIQDDKGYLWIATQSGLNRFNGENFVQFFPDVDDPDAVKSQMVLSLFKDKQGTIWFGGAGGLSYIDDSGSKFINYPLTVLDNKPLYVTHITAAENGNLWILGSKILWHFNRNNLTLKKADSAPAEIMFIFGDADENLWLGTKYGIFKKSALNSDYKEMTGFPEIGSDILDIKINNEYLWIVTTKKLVKLNLRTLLWQYETFNLPIKPIEMQHILLDKDDIWLSSMNGLWMKQGRCSCWHQYRSDPILNNALPVSQILSLYVDKQSQLWIGTSGGGLSVRNPKHQIIKHWLNKRQLSSFTKNLFFSPTSVTDINPDGRGNILVSTGEQGIFELSREGVIKNNYTTQNTPEMITNDINQVILDLHQRLWFSAFPEGIVMRTPQGDWKTFSTDENGQKNMQHEYVFELYEDRKGQIWAGTLAGAKVYHPQSNSFHSVSGEYPAELINVSTRTNVIRQTINGLYWFGTEGGIVILDRNLKFRSWLHQTSKINAILSDEINDLAEDTTGNIWVATGSGLNKISTVQGKWKITSFKAHPLLSTKALMMVTVDSNGIIWTAGNDGLMRFDPSTEELIVVPGDYGIQSQQFNPSSSFQDEGGDLYFGGVNGLNKLDHEFLPTSEINIPIRLAEVKSDGINVKRTENNSYLIPAKTKFTRFYFDILDLTSSANYELRIRIPEHSEQWIPWSGQRFFDFFELPTGSITLEVQSRSKSDAELLDEKSFPLFVQSFYSWYDYLIWISVALTLLFLLIVSRWKVKLWMKEKNILISEKLKLTENINFSKTELAEKNLEIEQLYEDLSTTMKHKELLENQLSNLHLIDKQTGLHTKDFIRLSIENATRQLIGFYDTNMDADELKRFPQLLFIIIKLDGFKKLRLEGGQFLLNQIIIQIAAEIKQISVHADELVRWNKDSFLLYSRSEDVEKIERRCQKIIHVINQGLFGPSETEKLPITCSIGVTRFPFNLQSPNKFDWTLQLEIASSAADYVNQHGGDGWLLVSEKEPQLSIEQVEQIINNFDNALESQLISTTSSLANKYNQNKR